MTKTVDYWRKAWDDARSESEFNENAGKTLNVLSQYAGFFKTIPVIGLPVAWGGHYGRFFSGRFRTQHGAEVQNAISNFYHVDGYYRHFENFHSVEFILARVKKQITTPIHPEGNLAKILAVIKEKTAVDYASLDADATIAAHNPNDTVLTVARI